MATQPGQQRLAREPSIWIVPNHHLRCCCCCCRVLLITQISAAIGIDKQHQGTEFTCSTISFYYSIVWDTWSFGKLTVYCTLVSSGRAMHSHASGETIQCHKNNINTNLSLCLSTKGRDRDLILEHKKLAIWSHADSCSCVAVISYLCVWLPVVDSKFRPQTTTG